MRPSVAQWFLALTGSYTGTIRFSQLSRYQASALPPKITEVVPIPIPTYKLTIEALTFVPYSPPPNSG